MFQQDSFLDYLSKIQGQQFTQEICNDLVELYKVVTQQNIKSVFQFITNLMTIGPISLISPELFKLEKQSIKQLQQLRNDYEVICCINENKKQNYVRELMNQVNNRLEQAFNDQNYLKFISDLSMIEQFTSISKEQFQEILQQVIDIQTIQEIAATQIYGSDLLESDQGQRKRFQISFLSISLFNYDGDEERTPVQSEDDSIGIETQKNKRKQDKSDLLQEQAKSDEEGYEASNSDYKTKPTKSTRNPRIIQQRRKQNQNAEFDTDRENVYIFYNNLQRNKNDE